MALSEPCKKENLATAGITVVIFDTTIALMAGLMIFPMLGGAPATAGPGLVFVVLIKQFQSMPAGQLVAAIFFGNALGYFFNYLIRMNCSIYSVKIHYQTCNGQE